MKKLIKSVCLFLTLTTLILLLTGCQQKNETGEGKAELVIDPQLIEIDKDYENYEKYQEILKVKHPAILPYKYPRTHSFKEGFDIVEEQNKLYLLNTETNQKQLLVEGVNKNDYGYGTHFPRFVQKLDDNKFVFLYTYLHYQKTIGIYDLEKKQEIIIKDAPGNLLLIQDNKMYCATNENVPLEYGPLVLTVTDLSFLQEENIPKDLSPYTKKILTDIPKDLTDVSYTDYCMSPDGKYFALISAEDPDFSESKSSKPASVHVYSVEEGKEICTYELKKLPGNTEGSYESYYLRFVSDTDICLYSVACISDAKKGENETEIATHNIHYLVSLVKTK